MQPTAQRTTSAAADAATLAGQSAEACFEKERPGCIVKPDSPFGERYELRNQLWFDGPHGGWLALDQTLGREVVVNCSYRPEDDHRFLQRAQIRARLRHANLIPIYDLGT